MSRQRYWGPPHSGYLLRQMRASQPVPESDSAGDAAPTWKTTGPTGPDESPAQARPMIFITPPARPAAERRSPGNRRFRQLFLCSAWYFYRYPSTDFDNDRAFRPGTHEKMAARRSVRGRATNNAVPAPALFSRFLCIVFPPDRAGRILKNPSPSFVAHGMIVREGDQNEQVQG